MIYTPLGLAVSAAFAGAAFYINWSEQPARLTLDEHALLKQWKPSYARGFQMQATLALAATALGIAGYAIEHAVLAGFGGALMFLNWPFTLILIRPANTRLEATPDGSAGPQTRALMIKWGRLHAVLTALGAAGATAFCLALAV
jgi:hypothetical protein